MGRTSSLKNAGYLGDLQPNFYYHAKRGVLWNLLCGSGPVDRKSEKADSILARGVGLPDLCACDVRRGGSVRQHEYGADSSAGSVFYGIGRAPRYMEGSEDIFQTAKYEPVDLFVSRIFYPSVFPDSKVESHSPYEKRDHGVGFCTYGGILRGDGMAV